MSEYNENRAFRLWCDIGGVKEFFLEELEVEAARIAEKAAKLRNGLKVGALVTGIASVGAAIALILLKPKLAEARLRKAG